MRSRPLSSQDGFTIIEVLVSTLILGIMLAGSITALISARLITGDQQRRGQAAALAAQDEDRLRSLPVSQLENYNQPAKTVTLSNPPGCVAGAANCHTETFTVNSTAQFVSEATGTSSCGSGGTADVIETSSTVSWNKDVEGPVTIGSMIAPHAGGGLVVQVQNASDAGVAGMTVTGTAVNPSTNPSFSGTTGSMGCAIFASLPGGTYNVSVSQPGYVDPNGNTTDTQAPTVVAGASTSVGFDFDQAAQITGSFQTDVNGSPQSAQGDAIVLADADMSAQFRTFGTEGNYASSVTASNVYPFTSPQEPAYAVYAGTCQADDPASNGAGPDPGVAVSPGGSAIVPVNLPVINLHVYPGTSASPGSPIANPYVRLTDTGSGCSGTRTVTPDTNVGPNSYAAPYGNYNLCASSGGYQTSQPVTNDALNGTTVNLYLGSGQGGTTGTCA